MWNKKILNYSNIFKAVYNNNPRTYSPQQNKQAVLTTAAYSTAAYFKVSTPLRSQRQKPRFVYQCFWYKTEKMNTTIEFCIFELIYNYSQNIWDKLCFRGKHRNTGNFYFPLFSSFLLVPTKVLFLEGRLASKL